MSVQGVIAGLVVLLAILFLVRRLGGTKPPKPRPGPDVPTHALLRKSRSRPRCSHCDD